MSCAVTTADLAPLGSWLPELDADRVERMLGTSSSHGAARRNAHLVGDPVALRNQLVLGKVRTNGGAAESVSVGLARNGELAALCSCQGLGEEPPCAHVAGLLDEMAASPPLRARLVHDSAAPPDPAAGTPPAHDLPRALGVARRRRARAASSRRRSPPGGGAERFARSGPPPS